MTSSDLTFVITYKHTPERLPLLLTCLETVPQDSETVIAEFGPPFVVNELRAYCANNKGLTASPYENLSQNVPPRLFAQLSRNLRIILLRGGFDRLRGLKVGVTLASNPVIVFSDADLIYPPYWASHIASLPTLGWSRMNYLTAAATHAYIERGELIPEVSHPVTPSLLGACGGAIVFPRDLYFEINGFPEGLFVDGYGGPDNCIWGKLTAYGFPFRTLPVTLYHLWHPRTTRSNSNRTLALEMLEWPREKWDSLDKTFKIV